MIATTVGTLEKVWAQITFFGFEAQWIYFLVSLVTPAIFMIIF